LRARELRRENEPSTTAQYAVSAEQEEIGAFESNRYEEGELAEYYNSICCQC
jgi:hypothetical protein